MQDIDFALHYPFSLRAKEFLANAEISERIIELASERIRSALLGEIKVTSAANESQKLDEIASFAAARMMLSHMHNRYVTARFAVAESKKANYHLSKDDGETVERIASEFGVSVKKAESGISNSPEGRQASDVKNMLVPVYNYVKFAPRDVHYKLASRYVSNGYILISESEKIRLLEDAVKKHVEKLPQLRNAPEIITAACERLISSLPQIEPKHSKGQISTKDFPPCIERIITSLKKHENLSHTQRWCLAVYLINAGMGMEEMVSMYSNLPDFNEKITSYQLMHAKKKGYSTPSCATMLSYGLACADCKLGSPVAWSRLSDGAKNEIRKKNGLLQ